MNELSRVTVAGLGGSLAAPSRSLFALKAGLAGAQATGTQIELLDLRELDLPMYRPDIAPPPNVMRMADTLHAVQGSLWSSPMYNGSISGAMKNALDWLHILGERRPPYLEDKVIGLISTAGGVQGIQAVNTMEYVVRALRAFSIPLVVSISHAGHAFTSDGAVLDPALEKQLHTLGREVARVAGLFVHGEQLEKECERARESLQALPDRS